MSKAQFFRINDGRLFTQQPRDLGVAHAVILQCDFEVSAFSTALYRDLGLQLPVQLEDAVTKRQAEFLVGRMLAREALIAIGRAPVQVPMRADRSLDWPQGSIGSISHSKGRGLCLAVADETHLCGIDIEQKASRAARAAILAQCATPSERHLMLGKSAEEVARLATLLFSAKETLYKTFHPIVRRYFGFECAEMRALPNGSVLRLCLTENLHDTLKAGACYDVMFDWNGDWLQTWMIVARP